MVAAGAWVHSPHELKGGGEGEGATGAGNSDVFILKGLAKGLERDALELEHLIQKEDTIMGEGDLARARVGAATDEPGHGDRVVRAPKGTGLKKTALVEEAGDGVYLGGVKLLLLAQGRED